MLLRSACGTAPARWRGRASASASIPAASSTRAARSFELMARPALNSNPVALNSNPVACHLPYRRVRQMSLSQRVSWRRRWRRGSCHTAGRAASADGDAIAETAYFRKSGYKPAQGGQRRRTQPYPVMRRRTLHIAAHTRAGTNSSVAITPAHAHTAQSQRQHRDACACGVWGVMWRAHTLDDTRGVVFVFSHTSRYG